MDCFRLCEGVTISTWLLGGTSGNVVSPYSTHTWVELDKQNLHSIWQAFLFCFLKTYLEESNWTGQQCPLKLSPQYQPVICSHTLPLLFYHTVLPLEAGDGHQWGWYQSCMNSSQSAVLNWEQIIWGIKLSRQTLAIISIHIEKGRSLFVGSIH